MCFITRQTEITAYVFELAYLYFSSVTSIFEKATYRVFQKSIGASKKIVSCKVSMRCVA